jgi:hypothetical protein
MPRDAGRAQKQPKSAEGTTNVLKSERDLNAGTGKSCERQGRAARQWRRRRDEAVVFFKSAVSRRCATPATPSTGKARTVIARNATRDRERSVSAPSSFAVTPRATSVTASDCEIPINFDELSRLEPAGSSTLFAEINEHLPHDPFPIEPMPISRSAVLCILVVPALLAAQAPARKIEGELSGNLFFGNTRQVLASLRGDHERLDSVFAFRVQSRFNYGETTTDIAGTVVSKRSWNAGSSYDFHPFADLSPFIRASVESSLENRIERRYSAGAGSRINVVRKPATDVIFSLGANGERTEPMQPSTLAATTLARGIASIRLRRDLTATMSLTNESAYQPALTEGGDYTVQSVTTLKTRLARFAALTFSFRDNFDSRATARGARTNNDGEVLVGLLTTF